MVVVGTDQGEILMMDGAELKSPVPTDGLQGIEHILASQKVCANSVSSDAQDEHASYSLGVEAHS